MVSYRKDIVFKIKNLENDKDIVTIEISNND